VVWVIVLLAHVILAVIAFRLLPQEFPIFHRRFVLSTLAPVCVGASSLALACALVFVPSAGIRFMAVIPAFWAAGALGLLLVFPKTGAEAARPMALVALQLAALAGFTCRKCAFREWLPAALLGAASGFGVAYAERPAPPTTQPFQLEPPRRNPDPGTTIARHLELTHDLVIDSSNLAVTWRASDASISIAPVLDFDRTPPDGFWSIFTDSVGAAPRVATVTSTAPGTLGLWNSDGAQRLFVQKKTTSVELEAWTRLAEPIYSHLNSFTTVTVSGHRRLALRFSPCPMALITVTHADYPAGAPARFAYVDAARRFHVVQAADAEKGPFTSLADGMLDVGAPLGIDLVELSEGERTIARLEFLDFAAQLSTALSPTAGHGVSENAIEFGLGTTDPTSPAQILLTLAGSGIGRGWDSVGHRAGVYRNRVLLHREAALWPRARHSSY
jgi:hypothetical protein